MSNRGADLLARTLVRGGVRRVFTLSGNHVMPVFDAALDAKIELLHVRHEAAAVHMADALGRLTGEAGVALVTGGPGHANAVSALYTALMGESPMVLISGHAPLSEQGKGAFQEVRQAEVAAPLAKASWTAQSVETLAEDVAKALRIARSGRPGPVHLSVPNDVLDATAAEEKLPATAAFAPERRLAEVASLLGPLSKAMRPVVVVGPAMMNARGRLSMQRLEAETGVPVIGMESPRGVNDPSLGRLAQVLNRADVAVLLGKRRDFTLRFGKVFSADCQVLDPGEDIEARGTCEAMANQAGSHGFQKSGWLDEAHAALRYRPPEWKSVAAKAGGVHPAELCRMVTPLLQAPDAVLVADGGEFGQWAQACLSAPHRVINGPAGSIGAALPFAAAAKLVFPHAPVVALMGDGTFGFHTSELDTAVRYGLPYIAVVGNDACWNAEYQIQLRAYGKERAHSLDLLPTRYGAVAAAFGGHGEDVALAGELPAALERAAKSGRVACVNVALERVAAPTY